MTKFNQGDAVIAKLPVEGFYPCKTMYVVAQNAELVTCLYFDGDKPVSVVIPESWLELLPLIEPQEGATFPHLSINRL
jgi:hypothetical protein